MTYLANKLTDGQNLGWFATPAALESAYPVGANGYFAMVGTTDTMWVWDEDSSAWVDTGVGGLLQASVVDDSSTSRTVGLTDAGKYIRMTNAGAKTVTVPPQSSVTWIQGTIITFRNVGAGILTFVEGSGVTVVGDDLEIYENETAQIIRVAADTWELIPGGSEADSVVSGPASATDNAVARYDGTTGDLIQDSGVIIDDSNNISGVGTLNSHTIQGGTGTLALTSDITGTNSGTNTGDQTITLTGDVTGTGTGSFATTIATDAVDIPMLSATGTADSSTYLRGDGTWSTPGGSSPVTTKGDLFTYSTADARLAVGSNGHILVADSAEATGLKWEAPTGGGNAQTANPLSQFASTTSSQLAGVISDETGTGVLVFATSPTLVTPILGVATATSINGATITSGTLNGSVTGTNTGDQTSVSGNAGTATTLQTARTIAGQSFDGSANITIASTDLSDTALLARLASPTFTGTVTVPATLTFTSNGSIVKSGAHAVTLTSTATSNATLPAGTTTLASLAGTETLTNKRITARVYTIANNASLTPEKDTYDIFHLTAMSANTTINNKSTTTYADGDQVRFRFLDNGTARTLTWGTDYVAKGGIALPTTTTISKNLELGFEYNSNLGKLNLIALAQEA